MTNAIQTLIVKYFTQRASLTELDELSKWIEKASNREEFIKYAKVNHAIDFNMKKFGTDNSKKRLLQFIEREKRANKMRRGFKVMKYAAVALIFLSMGYFFRNGFQEGMASITDSKAIDINDKIKAGSDKAILTLEDGSTIDLEKGKTIRTRNVKSNGKELIYDISHPTKAEMAYNYLTVPRGGQFHVKLADGTSVWLNSESQLKYPVTFVEGQTREVELVYGEAYFEVSPSTQHKGATFKVSNASQEIEVLGTAFNIKAYKDESNIYTTLVEGMVTINTSTVKKALEPNEQCNLDLDNNNLSINPVNVKYEISWRKGLFSFKGKSLEEIAKVLARWYNIDIQFSRPELKNVKFNGVLSKEENIEDILNSIITTNSINAYEIKNRKITIK